MKTKIKPRRMFINPSDMIEPYAYLTSYRDLNADHGNTLPVAVIPLEDITALITKAGDAFAASYDGHICQADIVAMLTAIGVLPKRKGGRK